MDWKLEPAQLRVIEHFGQARFVADQFLRERITSMQKLYLAIGFNRWHYLCLYRSRFPKWDDTGVLAFVILILTGLLALLGIRRPWLLALMVGACDSHLRDRVFCQLLFLSCSCLRLCRCFWRLGN